MDEKAADVIFVSSLKRPPERGRLICLKSDLCIGKNKKINYQPFLQNVVSIWYHNNEVLPMPPEVKEWVVQAEYDFSTAKAMFHSRKYLYMVYMCQLALEKALKAAVALRTNKTPPNNA